MQAIKGALSLWQDMEKIMQPPPGMWMKMVYLIDSSVSYVLLGATQRDYLDFEFYHKKYQERDTFLTGRRYNRMLSIYNDPESGQIFKNKARFSTVFADYLGRDWLDVDTSSQEEILEFLKDKDEVFIKPKQGEKGVGLTIEKAGTQQAAEAVYQKIKGQPLIMEERVFQHDDLAQLNPHLVNTIRIYTLLEENEVQLLSASLRIGRYAESIADNMSAGGILAAVDPITGKTTTPGVDKYHRHYELHPLTQIKICDFQIPCWKELTTLVKEAAQVVPAVRYVGWDLTVNQKGRPIVIEGNHNGGRRALQSADQVGKYYLFRDLHT